MRLEQVRFSSRGSNIQLQGIYHHVDGEGPRPAAVVCHPHPLGGGTMYNGVVAAVARALWVNGVTTLRFNFRGVEGSEGQHNHGWGEQDDVAGAFDWLAERPDVDPGRIAVVGYSFGAFIASLFAQDEPRVQALATVCLVALDLNAMHRESQTGAGPSLRLAGFGPDLLQSFDRPKLLIAAERDQFVPPGALETLVQRLPEPKALHIIGGTDHFLGGKEKRAGDLVASFLAAL